MTTRVAVLDDHRAFGDAMSLALDVFDEVESVGVVNSINALVNLVRVEAPHVVLVDYQLVEGTGIDCANRLADEELDVRMVMLTAHASLDVTSRALAAGFEQVLGKDTPLQTIVSALKSPPGPHARSLVAPEAIRFSRRQREVLELMGQGLDPAAIADTLFISVHTARSHVKDVLRSLGASTQLSAVTKAIREGYLLPPTMHDLPQR